MEEIILSLIAKYPIIVSILVIMGGLRVIFKPLSSYIDSYVAGTPSKDDDKKWDNIKSSKIYKGVAFVLDWLASIKLPK